MPLQHCGTGATILSDYLSDPGNPGVRSMGPGVSHSLSPRGFADLTDVTLADDDTNSILTDNANRAIQGNVRKSYLVRKSFLLRKSYRVRKSYPVKKSYLVRKSNQLRKGQVAPSGGQICN